MRGACEKFTTIIRNPLRTNANYNLKSIMANPQNLASGRLGINILQYPKYDIESGI